ncbi:MAG TPA: methyl-accepting chemotaxis protein, partial [Sphingobium sp.]|uniref:methyl-accepting chemotaxis protein n=1 Tax=Sphingobium sp. TaxID=1912891 RepID=UPI002ED289E2
MLVINHLLWGGIGVAGAIAASKGSGPLGIGLAVVALAGAVLSTWIAGRLICTPYVNTVVRMEGLASGDLDNPILHSDHRDCVGRMTTAMAVFRDNARRVEIQSGDAEAVVRRLRRGLDAVASGDMTYQITKPFVGDYDSLRLSFNSTVEGLERSLSQVASSAQSVHAGSTEIRAASEDLSRRTEQQAASLEETTAAMDQVTGMVGDTARGASEVRGAINSAHKDASEGGTVVSQAVNAMDAIEKSSQEIGQIISVIDGIAFQTNLLALNAGVEAA